MKWLDAFAAKIYIIFSAEQKFAPFPGTAGRQNNAAGCKTTVKPDVAFGRTHQEALFSRPREERI